MDNAIPQGALPWSMANTVLIDDSILKAKAQPHNLIQVPEFEWSTISGTKNAQKSVRAREEAILKSVQEKLEVLKYQANVACLIRQWQEGEKEAPGIVDEKVDQGQKIALKEAGTAVPEAGAEDYPTPTSLESASTQQSEPEYEPPEEVELVFRGRRNAGRSGIPTTKRSERKQESEEYMPPERNFHAPSVSERKDGRRHQRRSASPITEEHFKWMEEK